MNLSVTINAKEFTRALGEFSNQAPYILQKSINDTLVGAQKSMLSHVNDVFTIRRQAFAKQSFKMTKFATKADLVGTLAIASVGSRNTRDIFTKFEDGTRKVANGGRIAIPTAYIRPNASRVISSAKKPRNLTNSFKVTTKKGNTLIIQAKGPKKARVETVAYILKDSVRTPRVLQFDDITTAYINNNLNANLSRWTDKALATARLK